MLNSSKIVEYIVGMTSYLCQLSSQSRHVFDDVICLMTSHTWWRHISAPCVCPVYTCHVMSCDDVMMRSRGGLAGLFGLMTLVTMVTGEIQGGRDVGRDLHLVSVCWIVERKWMRNTILKSWNVEMCKSWNISKFNECSSPIEKWEIIT